jgi:DNA-binding FadR family transcriptional regulator
MSEYFSNRNFDRDALLHRTQDELEKFQGIVVSAVEIMENAANNTIDPETFKELTVGFHKIKDKING